MSGADYMNLYHENRIIYTLGYEKLSIHSFIEILQNNKIEIVADIREKPYSRKKDFSRKYLAEYLDKANIGYCHIQELGSPQFLRDKVRKDLDYDYFFIEYKKYLQSQKIALKRLSEILREKAVCLLCYERDEKICHRLVVAEKLAGFDIEYGHYQIIHLP